MWRVMTGLHKEIQLLFLLVGHTKFAPDWCFGLFKQLFKKTRVGTINDIAEVAEKSAVVNHAQLIGDYDGSIHVPMYNWAEFFEDHTIQTALKGISQMHHFRFTAAHPGAVFVKNACDDKERKMNLLKSTTWRPTPTTLPAYITPPGLSLERQWYLFNKIRDFCPDNAKDIVCPKPSTPLS